MKCHLICNEGTHDRIVLPHKESIIVGRSETTKICDTRCSRKQVELTSNYEKRTVRITQVGNNSSAVDNVDLSKGTSLILKEGGTLFILSGLYPHRIEFTPPSGDCKKSKDEIKELKRKSDKIDENYNENLGRSTSKIARKDDIDDDVEIIQRKLDILRKEQKSKCGTKNIPSTSKTGYVSFNATVDLPVSDSNSEPMSKWIRDQKLCVYVSQGLRHSHKISAFDIDGTLICTKSGRVFPKDKDDWRLWHPTISKIIKKLHASHHKVVLFTNQLGVSRGKTTVEELQDKFEKLALELGIPVQIIISISSGVYRKPARGMWDFLVNKGNNGVTVNMDESFYVGDAAGRPEKWAPGKKKDFSCSDRLFALNIGLKFYTPDEYFLNAPTAPYKLPDFDPRISVPANQLLKPPDARISSNHQELIVMVGYPASGKSFFAKEYLIPHGYVHINRDAMGSWKKCVASCDAAIKAKKSVVIDNTNPDLESRKRYTDVALKYGISCRCFLFMATLTQARHNERFREMTDSTHQPINDMIMNSYKSKYVEPKLDEGFSEIIRINLIPKFESDSKRKLYQQFLLER